MEAEERKGWLRLLLILNIMYSIKILKREEEREDKMSMMSPRIFNEGHQIFSAQMDSDNCIEILQHLHDLKEKGRGERKK